MGMNIGTTFNQAQIGADYKKSKTASKSDNKIKDKSTSEIVSKSNISKTNEDKLSAKAQEFLKNLRKEYGDYDFLVGNSTDDLKELPKSGRKEFSVIFSSEELERMANDEAYANEKMQAVQGAVEMSKKICEQEGFVSAFDMMNEGGGTVNKICISVDDSGNTKLFAELEKSSEKQKERAEKAKEKKAEEKAKDSKESVKAKSKNPYKKEETKRTTIEADTMEELIEKMKGIDWSKIPESQLGDRINFSV